jgi:hypothetical protein
VEYNSALLVFLYSTIGQEQLSSTAAEFLSRNAAVCSSAAFSFTLTNPKTTIACRVYCSSAAALVQFDSILDPIVGEDWIMLQDFQTAGVVAYRRLVAF